MGRTACTEPQCLYKGDLYLYLVEVNQEGFKLNGTHQLLVYADDVNVLSGRVHTVQENAEALVMSIKEIGVEVNADKNKYMVMSGDQNCRTKLPYED